MKSIVVANWKMNPATWRDAKRLFDATRKAADGAKQTTVIVAPPAIYLRDLAQAYKGRRISFAAQSTHFEQSGSHTGEISPAQARDSKASYVIVGHAERRAAGESDEDTAKKVAAVLAERMIPILCIGEKSRSPSGEHFTFVREQLVAGLKNVPEQKISKILLAYEPVWAIGAAKPMSPADMHEMAIFIRKTVVEKFGAAAMNVKILYGGSIDENNAEDMLRNGDVNGLLVGRASTEASRFTALVSAIA